MATVMVTGLSGMSALKGPSGDIDYETVLAGDHRADKERARDASRHPQGTLEFFGLSGDMSVAEIWPGGSAWYLKVIAPALKSGGGTYYAVTPWDPASDSERVQGAIKKFDETIVADTGTYGTVHRTLMRGASTDIAPDGSLDMVLTFRNVHNWMTGKEDTDFSQAYMKAFFKALKPGGILGVVEHRANDANPHDPAARNGYVHVAQVKALAAAAGFEFVEASQVNTNAADTKDHPFGVWTLAPSRRTSPYGQDPDPAFDRTPYDAIGESDRMTLKFRKP
jgi:predicted methyltransferase